jgi:hypothetical protein
MLENIFKLKYNMAYEAIENKLEIIGAAQQGGAVKARNICLEAF